MESKCDENMEKNSLCANKGQAGCDQGLPRWLSGKESTCNAGDGGLIPGSGRSPSDGNGNPLLVFWPGESHGQRSLMGYSPWGCRVGHD